MMRPRTGFLRIETYRIDPDEVNTMQTGLCLVKIVRLLRRHDDFDAV